MCWRLAVIKQDGYDWAVMDGPLIDVFMNFIVVSEAHIVVVIVPRIHMTWQLGRHAHTDQGSKYGLRETTERGKGEREGEDVVNGGVVSLCLSRTLSCSDLCVDKMVLIEKEKTGI